MTYTTPSTVMLVSAMLVATMTRLQFGGPGAKTRAYSERKLESQGLQVVLLRAQWKAQERMWRMSMALSEVGT